MDPTEKKKLRLVSDISKKDGGTRAHGQEPLARSLVGK